MRVGLIPTGVCEFEGLPDALSSLFAGHEFIAIPEIPPARPFPGFTCNTLSSDALTAGIVRLVDRFVGELAGRALKGYRGRLDLVVGIDDLELANLH